MISKKKLGILPRSIFAHFLHAFTAIHTFPYRSVKAMPKSSQHEDCGIALTYGWFGDVFLSKSVQNSAILADPILTFYKIEGYCR